MSKMRAVRASPPRSGQSSHWTLSCPRTATHWREASGLEARSLLKLYGIRFDILVTGRVGARPGQVGWAGVRSRRGQQPQAGRLSPGLSQAGKFGLIPTTITLGTGAAWLGVVSLTSWLPRAASKHVPPKGPPEPPVLTSSVRVRAGEAVERQVWPGHGSALPLPDHLLL